MELPNELIGLSARFATLIGENTVPAIIDRVNLAKNSKNKDQAIEQLEGIVMNLISEKSELIKIVQAYEQELIVRKISNEDITYITDKMVPLLEEFVLKSSDEDETEKMKEVMEVIKPIISQETFNIMQLLGFNFKKAIGEPLTELVKGSISSHIPLSEKEADEINKLVVKRDIEYWKAMQNTAIAEKGTEN